MLQGNSGGELFSDGDSTSLELNSRKLLAADLDYSAGLLHLLEM